MERRLQQSQGLTATRPGSEIQEAAGRPRTRSLDLGRPGLADTKPAAAGTEEVSGSWGGQHNGVSGAEGPRSRRGSRVLGQKVPGTWGGGVPGARYPGTARGARHRRAHLGSGSRIFLLARAAGVALLFSMAIR